MVESTTGPTRAALAVLAALLASCGGSGTPAQPTPTPTPVPTPLPPVVVAERTGVELQAGWIAWLSFPTSRAGQLEATVDWTAPENDLNVYIVLGTCDFDQLFAGQCEIVASSESPTAKPEVVLYDSTTASTYTIFVDNTGPGSESFSFQVVLRGTFSTSEGVETSRRPGIRVQRRPPGDLAPQP